MIRLAKRHHLLYKLVGVCESLSSHEVKCSTLLWRGVVDPRRENRRRVRKATSIGDYGIIFFRMRGIGDTADRQKDMHGLGEQIVLNERH